MDEFDDFYAYVVSNEVTDGSLMSEINYLVTFWSRCYTS